MLGTRQADLPRQLSVCMVYKSRADCSAFFTTAGTLLCRVNHTKFERDTDHHGPTMEEEGQRDDGRPPHPIGVEALEVTGFLRNFIPADNPPRSWPRLGNIRPIRWLVARDYPECFLAIGEDGKPIVDHFFCSGCKQWKAVSHTLHHISAHYSIIKHSERAYIAKHRMTLQCANEIRDSVIRFFAENGLPFRLIDSPDIQGICRGIPHRHTLRQIVIALSIRMKQRIEEILRDASRVQIAFDEWANRANKRFLGVNCVTWVHGGIEKFCLSCMNLDYVMQDRDHVTGDMIAQLVCDVITDYGIQEKVALLVTDGAAVMGVAGLSISQKLSRTLIHGRCVAHAINNLMGHLITQFRPVFNRIFEMRNRLSTLTFSHFLRRRQRKYTGIPSFLEIRWYSLFKTLKVMIALKKDIIDFAASEGSLADIDLSLFQSIEKFYNAVHGIKVVIQYMESDDFGVVGQVLSSLSSIREMINRLHDWCAEAPEALRLWNVYYEQKVGELRQQWGGILEVAAVLHPGVRHQEFLRVGEIDGALMSIRRSMAIYGYLGAGTAQTEKPTEIVDDPELAVMRLTSHDAPAVLDEVGVYLNRKRPDLTAAKFWANQLDLPYLSKVAHDYLAVIPNSAATERTFSCSGRIQSLKRLRLGDSSLEASVIVAMNPKGLLDHVETQRLITETNERIAFLERHPD